MFLRTQCLGDGTGVLIIIYLFSILDFLSWILHESRSFAVKKKFENHCLRDRGNKYCIRWSEEKQEPRSKYVYIFPLQMSGMDTLFYLTLASLLQLSFSL